MSSEAAIQRRIILALRERGAYVVKIQVADAGTPDLLVCYRGRFIAMEVKRPGQYPTAIQRLRLDAIRATGGHAGVVRSVEDALEALARAAQHQEEEALMATTGTCGDPCGWDKACIHGGTCTLAVGHAGRHEHSGESWNHRWSDRSAVSTDAALAEPEPQDVVEARLDGATLIANERLRQVEREGFDPDHDRGEHGGLGPLALAGVAYALHYARIPEAASYWPFANEWKPKDDLSDLVRAGALIAAEIDLLNGTAPSVTDERTRWAKREKELVTIVEAVARADNDDYIGEIKVDIPAGGYPRQSHLTAARAALGEERTTDG